MGLFYINTSAEESAEVKKRHTEEVKYYAKESRGIGENASNDIFPEFLWDPNLNSYDNDDYIIRGTCENPNVLKAYSIRRKYPNYFDYIDALDAYNDYMEYIESLVGDIPFNIGIMSDIYIPKRPKLTNKKSNKNLLRSGFMPSRVDEEAEIDFKTLDELINKIEPCEIIEEDDDEYELPKRIRKLHEKEIESKIKNERINGIYVYSSGKYSQGADAIINFLNNPNTDSIDNRGIDRGESFTDLMQRIYEEEHADPYLVEELYQPQTSYISNMMLIDPNKQKQQEILMALTECGFNFLNKETTAGMDKDVVRAVVKKYENKFSNNDNLSPKEIKKLKKKAAKERKKKKDRMVMDRRMQDILLRNRVSLSNDDNLSFRLKDIFPED